MAQLEFFYPTPYVVDGAIFSCFWATAGAMKLSLSEIMFKKEGYPMGLATTRRIDTIIIGAGLSGIYAASLLAEKINRLSSLKPATASVAEFCAPPIKIMLVIWARLGIGRRSIHAWHA